MQTLLQITIFDIYKKLKNHAIALPAIVFAIEMSSIVIGSFLVLLGLLDIYSFFMVMYTGAQILRLVMRRKQILAWIKSSPAISGMLYVVTITLLLGLFLVFIGSMSIDMFAVFLFAGCVLISAYLYYVCSK